MPRSCVLLALTATAAFSLAACGGADVGKVEKTAGDLLSDSGFPGSTVTCPSSVEVSKGSVFDCEVSGGKAKTVTLRSNDDAGEDLTLVKVDGADVAKRRAGGSAA